ncbi:hypothetical protein RFI_36288 [Reticulomyxa filosa]|uniref:Uncharacterized protein n=1 Tax=Reticulomyxa filosa TaxID=46433 RepID=X6LJ16_RETFI|nr:hypothetical protein RFI_36288 [Reticulomyxa filosa]|eukprot:ETO01152.1 hypothetical protein RFI_36288 [Reticulomyxa filosa]
MLGQNTPNGIGSSIRSNGKADILTTLPNMSDSSELSNAGMHGGIGNGYEVGNGIGHGIDMDFRNNRQRQSKIMTNGCRHEWCKKDCYKTKQPDSGITDNVIKKSKLQSSTLQVAVHSSSLQQNEEKKIEEVTFENVWKKNMKVRRQFMCSNTPTIVVTNIKFKELKSATAVITLLGLKNRNVLSRKVLAHTFSGNFRTLFVHFAVDLANNFNDSKNMQIEQKDNSNGNQRIVKQPRCDIYRKSFAAEQKKKREEAVNKKKKIYIDHRSSQDTS